jgi:hypothetical protein
MCSRSFCHMGALRGRLGGPKGAAVAGSNGRCWFRPPQRLRATLQSSREHGDAAGGSRARQNAPFAGANAGASWRAARAFFHSCTQLRLSLPLPTTARSCGSTPRELQALPRAAAPTAPPQLAAPAPLDLRTPPTVLGCDRGHLASAAARQLWLSANCCPPPPHHRCPSARPACGRPQRSPLGVPSPCVSW